MLFNTYFFLLCFLPVVLIGFYLLSSYANRDMALAWLVVSSLFFYSWWRPPYLALIIVSIAINYLIGKKIASSATHRKAWLVLGLALNLGGLTYYKYANFFVDSFNEMAGTHVAVAPIFLPLAISFFTLQQIAFLVDTYHGQTQEYRFLHYCLFVSFFPQLIAGPIVHHKEMMPQFMENTMDRKRAVNLAVGITIVIIGLFKKVVLADNLALIASPIFAAVGKGVTLNFFEAWGGILGYTFQLYFDFSGYSDMAIGLARMFGIKLPLNFFSPYKARNIAEVWHRWHMTLSRFLRDYLYIPLGGNRRGPARRYLNLMITFALGGFWHGAGWKFLCWGLMHGAYLCVYHFWAQFIKPLFGTHRTGGLPAHAAAVATTFFFFILALVFVRADTYGGAIEVLKAMFGANGFALHPDSHFWISVFGYLGIPVDVAGSAIRFVNEQTMDWFAISALLIWGAPNTTQIMGAWEPAFDSAPWLKAVPNRIRWSPSVGWASGVILLLVVALMHMNNVSEFLYFQF
jgi:D-alanyl-lipoteichoic acid acyltransferase DltB (MBOAT superfamily)